MSEAIALYNKQARSSDKYEGKLAPPVKKEFFQNSYIKRIKKGTSLDLCCGTGLIGVHFLRNKWNVFCLDGAINMLEECHKKGFKEENLIWADLEEEKIPFEGHKFDLVTCYAGLGYLNNATDVIEQMISLTKPSGRIIFNVNYHKSDVDEVLIVKDNFNVNFYAPSLKSVRKSIKKAGGNLLKVTPPQQADIFAGKASRSIFTIGINI